MVDNIYIITLENGITIENLKLNGNNFVSLKPIDPAIFDGNLGHVVISDGENEEQYENMELVHITQMGDEYWIALKNIPDSEIVNLKMRCDIDYLAMMLDVEI